MKKVEMQLWMIVAATIGFFSGAMWGHQWLTGRPSPNADLDEAAESINHSFRYMSKYSTDASEIQAKLLEQIEKIRLKRLEQRD
jgi:hypothetical protein